MSTQDKRYIYNGKKIKRTETGYKHRSSSVLHLYNDKLSFSVKFLMHIRLTKFWYNFKDGQIVYVYFQ